jgi:alkylhydroperoxidase family enzyme
MTTKNAQNTRIAPLPEPYADEIGTVLASMIPPGIPPLRLFRTLARNPRILKKIRASNLLDRGSIGRREREIVILRTTAQCGSEYEWGVHVTAFASHFGIDEETITATE